MKTCSFGLNSSTTHAFAIQSINVQKKPIEKFKSKKMENDGENGKRIVITPNIKVTKLNCSCLLYRSKNNVAK